MKNNNLEILNELISKGESFIDKLSPAPTVHFGSHRIKEKNNELLKDLTEWKINVIHFLKVNNLAEGSPHLEEFQKALDKKIEINGGEFYKENVSSAVGVLKSFRYLLTKK